MQIEMLAYKRGVADELAEEDLVVGVDNVDDEPIDLRLEMECRGFPSRPAMESTFLGLLDQI